MMLARVFGLLSAGDRPTQTDPCAYVSLLSRGLRFEVWDQRLDGRQELHAWAELPMSVLAGLVRSATACAAAAADGGAAEGGAGGSAGESGEGGAGGEGPLCSQSRLLPLITEFDEAGLAGAAAGPRGPALRVDLAYHSEQVLVPEPTLPAPAAPAAMRQREGSSAPTVPPEERAGRGLLAAAAAEGSTPGAADSSGAVGQGRQAPAPPAPRPAAAPLQQGQQRGEPATARPAPASRRTMEQQQREEEEEADVGSGEENDVLLANSARTQPVLAAPASKGIEAVLCVEVSVASLAAAAVPSPLY